MIFCGIVLIVLIGVITWINIYEEKEYKKLKNKCWF